MSSFLTEANFVKVWLKAGQIFDLRSTVIVTLLKSTAFFVPDVVQSDLDPVVIREWCSNGR